MALCLIALGSNCGDRHAALDDAVRELSRCLAADVTESRRVGSHPIGGPSGQGAFVNSVVRVAKPAPPAELLATCHAVERKFGPRSGTRWAARKLDVDLLLVDDEVIDQPRLRLPHPRMSFRPFVIHPAAELLPEWRHPEIDATLTELATSLSRPCDRLSVVGSGDEAARCGELAEKHLKRRRGVVVDRQDGGGLQPAGVGLTIDATDAGAACGGPRLRVADCDPGRLDEEIAAAIESVWPLSPPSAESSTK